MNGIVCFNGVLECVILGSFLLRASLASLDLLGGPLSVGWVGGWAQSIPLSTC